MKPPPKLSIRSLCLVAFVSAGLAVPALAAGSHDGHAHHAAMPVSATAEAPLTDGVVKKVDKSAGKVTISHGPLPNGMPAMTMAFRLKEMPWIDRMKAGQKIRFAASQIDGAMTLVRFEPAM